MRLNYFFVYFSMLLAGNAFAHYPAFPDTLTGKKLPEGPFRFGSVIKSNPLPIIWGSIPFTAEYRYVQEIMITPRQSTEVSFSCLGKSILLKIFEADRNKQSKPYSLRFVIRGYRFQIAQRFYLNKRYEGEPRGWYISSHLSYATANISDRFNYQYGVYLIARHFDMNLLVGKQKIKRKNTTWDYFFGLGYQKNVWYRHNTFAASTLPINIKDIPFLVSPVKITFGFNVGFALKP